MEQLAMFIRYRLGFNTPLTIDQLKSAIEILGGSWENRDITESELIIDNGTLKLYLPEDNTSDYVMRDTLLKLLDALVYHIDNTGKLCEYQVYPIKMSLADLAIAILIPENELVCFLQSSSRTLSEISKHFRATRQYTMYRLKRLGLYQ